MRLVIIGGGAAGISAAMAIRSIDKASHLTLIAKEPFLPYRRPLISAILEDQRKSQDISIITEERIKDLRIDFIPNDPVLELDSDNMRLLLKSKKEVFYDKLLIASGAKARLPKLQSISLSGVCTFRTIKDSEYIKSLLPGSEDVVVVGAGPAGIKVAMSLSKLEKKVTLVEIQPHVLPNILDNKASEIMGQRLTKRNIDVITDDEVVALEGKGALEKVILKRAGAIEAKLAIFTTGILPELDFIRDTKLEISKGILVNEYMQTSDPNIYAAGDVAEAKDILTEDFVLTPIWPEAVDQGRIAGLNMCGMGISYQGPLRRNVIDVEGTYFMSAGLVEEAQLKSVKIHSEGHLYQNEDVVCMNSKERGWYRRFLIKEGRLMGFVMVNRIESGGFLCHLMRNKVDVRPYLDELLNPDLEQMVISRLGRLI